MLGGIPIETSQPHQVLHFWFVVDWVEKGHRSGVGWTDDILDVVVVVGVQGGSLVEKDVEIHLQHQAIWKGVQPDQVGTTIYDFCWGIDPEKSVGVDVEPCQQGQSRN